MKHAGLNMGQVKINNRSSILKYINDVGPVSRKDIALATGLTPAAVTQICNNLILEGILVEKGTLEEESKSAGRKKILVDIDYDFVHVLAANIESEETYIAIVDMKGRIIFKDSFATDKNSAPEIFLKTVASKCQSLLNLATTQKIAVQGMCVTVPGNVDQENGISWHAYGIWDEEVPVCSILKKELDLEVILENNVNAFCIAEMLYGVGKKYDNFMVVKWGPGVGSTIVVDNKIYEGRHNRAAELGHYIVDVNGRKCSCGKTGCLETKVSLPALQRIMNFNPLNFYTAIENADEDTRKKLDDIFQTFAVTLVNAITILAPNRVVLCGRLFQDSQVRNMLVQNCRRLNTELSEERIIYTGLSGCEEYIGPAAVFMQRKIFGSR